MAKRLRSLASVLWDADCPDNPADIFHSHGAEVCHQFRNLEEENASLLQQLANLQEQMSVLPKPLPYRHSRSELLRMWPRQTWIANLREDVVVQPRLWQEILPELHETNNCRERILFDLCKSQKATASSILSHAEQCIHSLSRKHPAVFKVGISSNPVRRWNHTLYGYAWDKKECWLGMKILAVCETSLSCAFLESALIRLFRNKPGCRNDRPGGESPSADQGPHFTYIVYNILLPPNQPIRVISR